VTDTGQRDRDRKVLRVRQERWATKVATDACWYISEPPPELARAVGEWAPVAGDAALDIGCGPGTIAAHLADRFPLSVGFDVALGAAQEARRIGRDRPRPPRFLVAEAPRFPFASETFSLVFDRGVLHHVPAEAWPRYFREVTRILRPGGLYFQYCPRRPMPRLVSYRGLRARGGRVRRRRPAPGEAMRRATPPSMPAIEIHEVPFAARDGRELRFTFGLFKKDGEPGAG
jgi:SAM-dependent methyltransferase